MTADVDPPVGASDRAAIERIISLIDLTDLDDAHAPDGIAGLLSDALRHRTAAVCVWPEFVGRSARELSGSGVRVATVANFPEGTASASEVATQVATALVAGADDVDVVLPWRRFSNGDVDHARAVVEAAAEAVHDVQGALLKVILETGELQDTSVIAAAAQLAIDCGADFLKTSTGKTATGASIDAVGALLDVIASGGGAVGVKPSGGVRTVSDAAEYLALASARLGADWATPRTFRFGASGLLGDALTALRTV